MLSKRSLSIFNSRRTTVIALAAWLVLLVVQGLLTPLHIDECYYRLYGQCLAWGYFDHPPGVALATWLSSLIFSSGNLSVRIVPIILHVLTLIVGWHAFRRIMPQSKKISTKALIAILALPLFHIYSFIATPDVVLLFTAVIFLHGYVIVKQAGTTLQWLWWGISMALLMYSKYHGILIIGFLILSDLKLLTNPRFYLAVAVSLIAFLPHLHWQYSHDWASIRFHLVERQASSDWYSLPQYLGMLILILNPFLLWIYGKPLITRPKTQWDRTMLFIFWGIVGFFLFQSARTSVQAQWLFLVYIPFGYFILSKLSREGYQASKGLRNALLFSLPFLMIIHICLTWNVLPSDLGIFGQKEYATRIKSDAQGSPVVFYNSYKRASVYSWYSQEYAHSYNSALARKNQFNIWHRDSILFDREVYFVGMHFEKEPATRYSEIEVGTSKTYYPGDKVRVYIQQIQHTSDSVRAEIMVENPYARKLEFPKDYHLVGYLFSNDGSDPLRLVPSFVPFTIPASDIRILSFSWVKPKNIDRYSSMGISIGHNEWPDGPILQRFALAASF